MAERCLLYYITDRSAFPGNESARRTRLLEKISEAGTAGVEFIQLREKDLPTRELESLAREAVSVLTEVRTGQRENRTKLLINSRTDVALASGADGVHLRSDDIFPPEVRAIWKPSGSDAASPGPASAPPEPLIAVSCHTSAEVNAAAANGADFAVFAPVFQKHGERPAGLNLLREACQAKIRVLALGGVTLDNAQSCLQAGAAGIAAIRLFQENDIAAVVRRLRNL
jgi:thiamine-phosphate pyrophosphorylase